MTAAGAESLHEWKLYCALVGQMLLYIWLTQMEPQRGLAGGAATTPAVASHRFAPDRQAGCIMRTCCGRASSHTSIAAQLRQRRWHWICHFLRMGYDRLAKQLLYSSLDGNGKAASSRTSQPVSRDMESVLSNKQRITASFIMLQS